MLEIEPTGKDKDAGSATSLLFGRRSSSSQKGELNNRQIQEYYHAFSWHLLLRRRSGLEFERNQPPAVPKTPSPDWYTPACEMLARDNGVCGARGVALSGAARAAQVGRMIGARY